MPPPLKKQRSSQPKEYRKFDPLTKTIRDAAIKGCVDIYLKHVKDNGGACKRGFLQSIVVTANEKASGLQITRDDIKNVVRRIEKEEKKNAPNISPIELPSSIPKSNSSLHSIDNNLLSVYESSANDQSSTSSDDSQPTPLSGSSLSGLDILATAAANKQIVSLSPQVQEEHGVTLGISDSDDEAIVSYAPKHTVRAHNMLKHNMHQANEAGELSYNALSSGHTRRVVAGAFFQMLQLNDMGFVELKQASAYGDIAVAPGPRFEEQLEVEDLVVASPASTAKELIAVSSVVASPTSTTNELIVVSSPPSAVSLVLAPNKGGRPKGSTNANKRRAILDKKRAVNWVCHQYHNLQAELKDANKSNQKNVRLKAGTREKLIIKAKATFNVKGDFDVPKQTIHNRINSANLQVWHTGEGSPVIVIEVLLTSYIITAWAINCPLSVADCIDLMNGFIDNTVYEVELIKWKQGQKIYYEDADLPLLGVGWWRGFKRRNPELESKTGSKYAKNRAGHCTHPALKKMYKQVEGALVLSGNAVRFDEPKHMDRLGNIVQESLAFGLPVTIAFRRARNCFVLDETGTSTHGKDDCQKGGQKKVVPAGEIPREMVGIKHSHFSVLPISNFEGELVFVTVIFASEKLNPTWALGVDVFSKWDAEDYSSNFAPGKRHPGLVGND